ncbi:MAG TPA: aspartate racemase [Pasteurellaceae bacterium]|nr:aspartate racemase [Pasteurellaceae bacterium]
MTKNVIGILGGMGPAATVDMCQKFLQLTPATCDQAHIPLLISSIPDIPDRSACILHGGEDPISAMTEYVKRLEAGGATCIIIACNTAHYWFDRLKEKASVEMLSMIDTVVDEVVMSGCKNIGLLATDATLASGLYKQKLEARGLNCIYPSDDGRKDVMKSIYLLKAGETQESVRLIVKQRDELIKQGVELIILGCTEVPIILAEEVKKQPHLYVDSTLALVKAAIKWYQTH